MIPDAIYVDETEGQQDEIITIMEDEWATDKLLISSLVDISLNATKVHTDKYGNESESPDFPSRLSAIKELNRMKAEARKTWGKKRMLNIMLID